MGGSTGKVLGTVVAGPVGFVVGSASDDAHAARHAQRKAQHAQNRLLREQQEILKEQKEQAEAERREQIDQQREQIIQGNYKTNQTSTTGITAIRGTLG